VRDEFCRDFCPFVFFTGSQPNVKKAKAFSAFLDKGKLLDFSMIKGNCWIFG